MFTSHCISTLYFYKIMGFLFISLKILTSEDELYASKILFFFFPFVLVLLINNLKMKSRCNKKKKDLFVLSMRQIESEPSLWYLSNFQEDLVE